MAYIKTLPHTFNMKNINDKTLKIQKPPKKHFFQSQKKHVHTKYQIEKNSAP